MAPKTAVVLIVIAVAGGIAAASAQDRRPAPSQDIMPALLTEVRGLRAAMEAMASSGARVQLALGRVQLQEQRLNTSIRRLEEVRGRLNQVQRSAAEHQNQIDGLEANLKEPPGDPAEAREVAAQIEGLLGQLRRQSTLFAAEVQQLTADEAALASDVASEQARWTEYNQRLEELERSLGR
jgi:chromosome segregation ATPase